MKRGVTTYGVTITSSDERECGAMMMTRRSIVRQTGLNSRQAFLGLRWLTAFVCFYIMWLFSVRVAGRVLVPAATVLICAGVLLAPRSELVA
jgi:hypothetical protein